MGSAEIRFGAAAKSDHGSYILRRLPQWMPRDDDSGNYKMAHSLGLSLDDVESWVEKLESATSVYDAETVPQLREQAKLVDLEPQTDEALEKYRTRVIAEFQTSTTEGTPRDLIENTATLLDTNPSEITYERTSESGSVLLHIPGRAVDDLPLSDTEFIEIVNKHIAAGFRIDATRRGTFTYLPESAYSGPYDSANGGYDPSQLNSDATLGHDGLDTNGDPKDTGGTYAGLIE